VAAVLDAHRSGRLLALRTSGTSGKPRAVVRTTASWVDSFATVTRLLAMDATSRVWVPGPLASTMNLFSAVHATHLGATLTVTSGDATHAVLTPASLAGLLARGADLTGRHLLVAGDALPRRLRDQALAAGACQVSHYYGAAELSFVAWGSHVDDLAPFPAVEVEARDGALWVRSPYLCRGYDGAGGPLVTDTNGFASVGDRGSVENGLVHVRGRGGDTVVTAGATVFTGEVEDALERATGHRPVLVGVPHPDLGEVLCGLVPDPSAQADLRSAARRTLAPAARPRRWFVLDGPAPLTEAGKLDRARIVEMLSTLEGVSRLV
jgi:long-chain acyl-CoA synthetase